MFPIVSTRLPGEVTLAGAVVGVFGELAIGLIIGLGSGLMFAGVQLAGMIIGQQAGLSLGQVFNPVMDTDATTLGEVFFMVALTVFVLIGGHRELMRALLDTYESIPVLSFRFSASWITLMTGLLTSAFTLALRLAGPVLISLMLATLVLGFLSRTMPQLNILSVGFVVRVLVALGASGLALSAAEGALTDAIRDSFERIRTALGMA
jgi:flagellar biosynthetic protein FliR